MELPPLSGPTTRLATNPGKTTVACDTCRQRKSRCDGMRPRCTHCANAGVVCNYRPTPTSLETDESVLSRLANVETRLYALRDVEARLLALEDQRANVIEDHLRGNKRRRVSTHGGPDLPDHGVLRPALPEYPRYSTVDSTSPAAAPTHRTNDTLVFTDEGGRSSGILLEPPLLHTASACQMLHSWPRLRVCVDDDVDPLKILQKTDEEHPLLDEKLNGPFDRLELDLRMLVDELDFHSEIHRVPAAIRYLFETGLCIDKESMIGTVRDRHGYGGSTLEQLKTLGMAVWVVLSMALPIYSQRQSDPELEEREHTALNWAAQRCLRLALERYATAHYDTLSERVALPLALAYSLVFYWARPFQALEVLQSIDVKLKRWCLRAPDDPQLVACCRLYVLLESDLLTEIDETCSETILLEKSSAFCILRERPRSLSYQGEYSELTLLINDLIKSRYHMDDILQLYTPSRAYARPSDLKDTVEKLLDNLSAPYWDLLPSFRFHWEFEPMKEAAMEMNSNRRELAFRFFTSLFLIHRPVLYFFLHQDLENNIQPQIHLANPIDDFTLKSCMECVRSAILLIYTAIPTRSMIVRSWCDYQILFAAYMVILQVKDFPTFASIFRQIGESLPALLDRVEEEFSKSNHQPLVGKILDTMKLLRRRFGKSHLQRVLEST